MALAALIVSVLALATSWLVVWRQMRWTKLAMPRVRTEPASNTTNMLVAENMSETATAYDVTVDLESRATGAVPELLDSPFPATIPPRTEATALLDESLATAAQLTATLKWRDGRGRHEERVGLSIR